MKGELEENIYVPIIEYGGLQLPLDGKSLKATETYGFISCKTKKDAEKYLNNIHDLKSLERCELKIITYKKVN